MSAATRSDPAAGALGDADVEPPAGTALDGAVPATAVDAVDAVDAGVARVADGWLAADVHALRRAHDAMAMAAPDAGTRQESTDETTNGCYWRPCGPCG